MLPSKIAFVDTETTGLSVTRDRIIEIGILRVENGKIVKKYQTLVDPGFIFPDVITSITGITPKDLEKAPTFRQVKDEVRAILTDCVLVAHNVRFDYAFLKNEYKREGVTFSSQHFCTVRLSQSLFPQEKSHNLDSIIRRFDISVTKRHRAFDDAYVLWEFYQKLQKQIDPKLFEESIQKALKRPSRPLHVPAEIFNTLPERAGVYVFYGSEDAVLYIGKSVNMKERILSHFSQDYTSSKEMHIAQQVQNIKTYATSGELGALLKEAVLIKALQPLYNRKLRQSRKLVLVSKLINTNGYIQVQTEEVAEIDPFGLSSIVGVFKSKRQAHEFLIEIASTYRLCEKLLGLEKSKTSCFAYQLGRCNGACIEKEKPIRYNIRAIEALSAHQIKKWPFDGAIAIAEKDELEETVEYFVVDKWCLLGSFTKQGENDLQTQSHAYSFDVDTYKILVGYLSKKNNWKNMYKLSLSNFSLASLSANY